jgi:hypothetical protein
MHILLDDTRLEREILLVGLYVCEGEGSWPETALKERLLSTRG